MKDSPDKKQTKKTTEAPSERDESAPTTKAKSGKAAKTAMADANSKITHKSPRKEAPNSSLVNFFKKTPTKPSVEEQVVEESFTIDAKIPKVITEVIAKSAVVPEVEMAEEPVVPTETDEVMKEPAKPKAKAASKRESKPEPEIPAEVSIDTLM